MIGSIAPNSRRTEDALWRKCLLSHAARACGTVGVTRDFASSAGRNAGGTVTNQNSRLWGASGPQDVAGREPAAVDPRKPYCTLSMQRLFTLSLKTRIALVTTSLAAIMGGGILLASLHAAHEDLRHALQEQQDSVVKLTAEQLDTAMQARFAMLSHLAGQLSGSMDAPPALLQQKMLHTLPIPETFDAALIADASGRTLTHRGGRASIVDRFYFQEVARTKAPIVSWPIRARSGEGREGVLIAVPILSRDQRFLGLLGGWIDLSRPNFLVEVSHSAVGATGYYCVVSAGARPVYVQHRSSELIGRPARAIGETCGADQRPGAWEFLRPRAPVIGRYLMSTTGWELVSVLPAEEAFHPLRGMQQRFITLSLAAVAVGALLNWLFVRGMLAPLSRLRRVVEDSVQDPAAYERLSADRHDEIGVVSGAFAALMRKVHERTEQRNRSEQRLRAVTDTLPSLLSFIDTDQRYVFNNAAYERAFGIPVNALRGKTVREVLGEARYAAIQPRLQQALAGQTVVFETEHPDPQYHCLETSLRPEWSADGREVTGVHIHVQDVTERKLEAIRLAQMSRLDPLTQDFNRAAFSTLLPEAMARCRAGGKLMAVMYLDLDRFKAVNDTHGHVTGDLLLQNLSKRVRRCVRERDAVARLGGDEFAVILEDIGEPQAAERVAAAILHSVGRPFFIDGVFLNVNVSIGIALYRDETIDEQELTRRADALLYRAKAAGRGRYEIGPAEPAGRTPGEIPS
ncbi:PAS domain S-box-containing protein/diguanylate cyclase (GGDEF)-like protein [Cupriavidus gilardii J11]|uniref:PAS domain S-box-containing protein/diguanylate cyclase (GGDEF)-like protein n=1 Tax=Cupriavidus gilardii J11 TaxID=936133 RepID=A0A562BRC0_9BURK|nr:PAS domain S-box-containing protein/diguanylate cyclase (GGDEF)-like protein [Cupriavidus gilardii J11]